MKILALAVIFAATVSTAAIAKEGGCRPHHLTKEQLQTAIQEFEAGCDKARKERTPDPLILKRCDPNTPLPIYREGC